MIVTPGLSTWLLLRLAIGLIVVLAISRAMFGAYQRGRAVGHGRRIGGTGIC